MHDTKCLPSRYTLSLSDTSQLHGLTREIVVHFKLSILARGARSFISQVTLAVWPYWLPLWQTPKCQIRLRARSHCQRTTPSGPVRNISGDHKRTVWHVLEQDRDCTTWWRSMERTTRNKSCYITQSFLLAFVFGL